MVGAQQAEFYVLQLRAGEARACKPDGQLRLRTGRAPTARNWTWARAWSASARFDKQKILLT